ncbi:lasso peptide biosynthesis B2 protein [Desulfogranum mediterraneum]|uniref:lasso peptide biosynthesis B2 protein n=1 Tax=Desulfogranum mediterraneum TaxID=160661 RepID=UPI0006891993|nr:lasso peptide biosynthesis B2 protein [Desulfogranum mediterraneum]
MFRPLQTFFTLSRQRQKLLCCAVLLALVVRVGLALLPLGQLLRFVGGKDDGGEAGEARADGPAAAEGPVDPDRRSVQDDIIWAVQLVDRRFSWATCLVNGLVAQYLFSRNGIPSQLHIGVKKEGPDRLQAHAWVTVGGTIVIGRIADLATYRPLPQLRAGG